MKNDSLLVSRFVRAQVAILRRIAPPVPLPLTNVYDGQSKLAALFEPSIRYEMSGRRVVDFGSRVRIASYRNSTLGERRSLASRSMTTLCGPPGRTRTGPASPSGVNLLGNLPARWMWCALRPSWSRRSLDR